MWLELPYLDIVALIQCMYVYRNIYAVLATALGCEQPSQRVVLTFLARCFVTICE